MPTVSAKMRPAIARVFLTERLERQPRRDMTMWKDNKTDEEVLEQVLRSYLIRCHRTVSKDYPEIASMEPTQAADYLLHLRKTGRIEIRLFNKTPTLIGCKITELESAQRTGEKSSADAVGKNP